MTAQQQEIAFRDFLSRNCTTLNSICLRFCGGNAFYFDELRQECILALWNEFRKHGVGRFRGDSAEATWINEIAFHAIVHYLRNPKYSELQSVEDINDMEDLILTEWQDDLQLLDELMEQLDSRERILLTHYLNDDTYAAIARSEGITEANARKRMSRLINKLKMLINK